MAERSTRPIQERTTAPATTPGALDLEENILAAIRRIVRAIDIQSRKLVASCGLTGPQLVTLRAIDRLGSPSLTLLSREVSIGKATLTGIVDRLERQRLVARTRDSADRRRITVSLTAAGEKTLAAAPPLLQDRFRSELAGLRDWERAAMLSTLQRVAEMLDAEDLVLDDLDAGPILESDRLERGPAKRSS